MKTNPELPSFPQNQALLWLPKWSSRRTAFTSRNYSRQDENGKDIYGDLGNDEKGNSLCAPFPCEDEQAMQSSNSNCSYPYLVIPIPDTMTELEINNLGNRVAEKLGKGKGYYDIPIRSLKMDRSKPIIEALTEMGFAPQWKK